LCVEHARSDTSEGSDVSEAVVSDENTVKVPCAKESDDVKQAREHVGGREVRVGWVIRSGLIAVGYDE